MKIIGNEEKCKCITLVHNGKNMKFQCVLKPIPYMPQIVLEKDKKVEIIFDDLLEVNELISILEHFKEECGDYIGSWQRQ